MISKCAFWYSYFKFQLHCHTHFLIYTKVWNKTRMTVLLMIAKRLILNEGRIVATIQVRAFQCHANSAKIKYVSHFYRNHLKLSAENTNCRTIQKGLKALKALIWCIVRCPKMLGKSIIILYWWFEEEHTPLCSLNESLICFCFRYVDENIYMINMKTIKYW